MARLQLSKNRTVEKQDINIGQIILFCEGNSEKYYFDYFANIINNDSNKYNNVIVKTETASGNAQAVLNYSIDFLSKEENNRVYKNYEKYLIFDCDSPKGIINVIKEAAKHTNEYHLLISYIFFEIWLLMHFEDVNIENGIPKNERIYSSKTKIFKKLTEHLSTKYKKAQKGLTRKIILKGNVEKAIENAKYLDDKYKELNYDINKDILLMCPYSNVYTLVEKLMILISN